MLTRTEYLEGLAYLVPTLAACALAGWLAVRRRLWSLDATSALLAGALVASAALVAVHLLPGAAGILSRGSVLGAAIAVLALAAVVPRSLDGGGGAAAPPPPSTRSSWALAAAGASVAGVGAIAYLVRYGIEPPTAIDAVTFHLPGVARWIQSGSFWQLDQFTPDLSHATYPHNGNLVQLAAVLPWQSVFAIRLVGAPFLALIALGVFAIARELGAARATAVLSTAAVAVIPAVAQPALEQVQVDPPMLAWFGAGSLFLVRYSRTGHRSDLVLSGLGLGLAFGTKWYGPPYVAIALVVLLAAALIADRSRAVRLIGPGAALVGLIVASGGFWLVRNWVEAGNPLHPTPVELLGVTIFDAPPDPVLEQGGFSVSNYLLDLPVWREYLIPAFRDAWGLSGPLLALLSVLAGVAAWRARRQTPEERRAATRVLAVAAATLLMAVAYTAIPYTALGPEGQPVQAGANARYLVPALLGAAALAAWVTARVGRWRTAVEVALLVGVLDGVRRAFAPAGVKHVAAALAIVLVAGAVAAAAVWLRRRGLRTRRSVVAATAAVALLAGVLAGEALRQRWPRPAYGTFDPALAWIEANAPRDARIGLAGLWSTAGLSPVLPAFGPDLDNRVQYVGDFIAGTLRRPRTAKSFGAALVRAAPDLLVVGRGFLARPGDEPAELGWALRRGFRPVVHSPRLVLLRRD